MSEDEVKLRLPVQGWTQFLTARREMLDAYDRAREKARSHEVQVYHGNVAEAQFRDWLASFLPKRYGVTAGYIISQGAAVETKAPHFDVIIYDALESPVLWVEGDPDTSAQGSSRAIPAEYVLGVLEVKASLSPSTMKQAVEHLSDLSPLMRGVDEPSARYKLFLPSRFFCGVVFFELREPHKQDECAVTNSFPGLGLRGFIGGIVLRGEGHDKPLSARITYLKYRDPGQSTIVNGKASLLGGAAITSTVPQDDSTHLGAMFLWGEENFSRFAFDVIGLMQGTYEPGRLSSFHGFGSSWMKL